MHSDRNEHTPVPAADRAQRIAADSSAQMWPTECQQFDEALARARQGAGTPAVLVGEPGRGKTTLLSSVIRDARSAGDLGMHVHLDRYFDRDAFSFRTSTRFVELHPGFTVPDNIHIPAEPSALPALFTAADGFAAENGLAVVLGLSGFDASLDAPPDLSVFELAAELIETAQSRLRHTLTIVELRSQRVQRELEGLARSGLVYFPVGNPSDKIVAQILTERRPGMVAFSPTVVGAANSRARGNLHRLKAAMRTISARAMAAEIGEVGPVEWEALVGKGISNEIDDAVVTECEELLKAIADWPASGYIPIEQLAWRLHVESAAKSEDEVVAMVRSLQAQAAVLGLEPTGDPLHLRFEWPELRTAMTRSVHSQASPATISKRRALQAAVVHAWQAAMAGRTVRAVDRADRVVADSDEPSLEVFRRQAATIAADIWQGLHGGEIVDRASAARVLARGAGAAAVPFLVEGLKWQEAQLQQVAAEALVATGEPGARAVAQLLGAGDYQLRLRAIDVLSKIPGDSSLGALLPLLEEPDTDLRLTVLKSLATLNDLRAGDTVAGYIVDSDPQTRKAAIECIAELNYAPAVGAVAEALVDETEDVRDAAALALGQLGDEQAIPALLERLGDARTQKAAAKAMAFFGEPARKALLEALQSPETTLRAAAYRGFEFFPVRQAVPSVLEGLRDPDATVVESACRALADFASEAVQSVASLFADRDETVRSNAAHAMALIGEPAIDTLRERLSARAPFVRCAAASALGEMKHEPSIPALSEAAADREAEVRLSAVAALSQIGTEEALGPVVAAMSDPDESVSASAAGSIVRFGAMAVGPLLAHLLDDSGSTVEVVAAALTDLGREALPAVCDQVRHGDMGRKLAGIEMLGRIADPSCVSTVAGCLKEETLRRPAGDLLAVFGQASVAPLMDLIGSGDAAEREAACTTVVRIGEPSVDSAISALRADSAIARTSAAWILGNLAEPRAVGGLIEGLADTEPAVRSACAVALGQLRDGVAVAPLVDITRDSDGGVVAAAASALAAFGRVAVEALLASYEAHAGYQLQQLAAVLRLMPAPAVEHVCDLLASDDSDHRRGAINVLSAIRHEPAIPQIARLLTDPNEAVANLAHTASVAFAGSAVGPLVQLLMDPVEELRRPALTALVEIGQVALPALLELLADDAKEVRNVGAWAVSAFGEDAVGEVGGMLLTGEQPHSRAAAAACLARIGTLGAVDALIDGLVDPVAGVRVTVVKALSHASDERAVGPLLRVMVDEDESVATATREAVARFGERALPGLLENLVPEDERMQEAVRQTLVQLGARSVAPLLKVLGTGGAEEQAVAIGILQELAAAAAVEPVLDLLNAPPPAADAARSFALANAEACLGGLVARLAVQDEALRTACADVCVAVGNPAVPALIEAVEGGNPVAQIEAIDALAKISDERAVDPIILVTRSGVADVRAHAAAALGVFGKSKAIQPLADMIVDGELRVRDIAAHSLAAFGKPAVSTLIEHFRLAQEPVTEEITQALEIIGGPANESLGELVHAQAGSIRAGAIRCLTALSDERVLEQIPSLLGDQDETVQQAVVEIVQRFGEAVLPHVMQGLAEGEDSGVALAGECLVVVGEPAVTPTVELLTNLESANRARSIPVLARLGSPRAIAPLIRVMAERDESIRLPARDAVVSFGQAAVGPLLDQLENPNPVMRDSVADVLARLDDVVRPAMLEILESGTAQRQAVVIGILKQMQATEAAPRVAGLIVGDPGLVDPARDFLLAFVDHAIPALRDKLGSDDPELRDAAAGLLVEIGEPALREVANAIIEDTPVARVEAAGILAILGGEAAGEALTLAVMDAEASVRIAAVTALGRLDVLEPIMVVVEDPDEAVRSAAIQALVAHGQTGLETLFASHASPVQNSSAAVIEAFAAFGDGGVRWLSSRLETADAEDRASATRILVGLRHGASMSAIVALLRDPDNRVRTAAAEGLVECGEIAAVPLTSAATSDDATVSEAAGECLVRIGEGVVAALIGAASDPSRPARTNAVALLARINPPQIGKDFIRWLSDSEERMRIAAARAIQEIRHERALPNLLDGIDEETDACRDARLEAVCSFGEVAVPVLIEKMEDPAWSDSPALARALAALGDVVEDAIIELLDDPEPKRRLLAARTLEEMALERSAPRLLMRVADADANVRRAVSAALAVLPASCSIPLLDHLNTEDPAEQAMYVEAVVAQGDELLDAARRKLSDPDPAMRCGALAVAGRVIRDRDFSAVAANLTDAVARVRLAAVAAVETFGHEEAASALADIIHDTDSEVFEAVGRALRAMAVVSRPVLLERLITGDGELDPQVALVMQVPEEPGMAVLREFVGSPHPGRRAKAARALGLVADPQDVALLSDLLGDREQAVRDASIEALFRYGGQAAGAVAQVLWTGELEARRDAVHVLIGLGSDSVRPLLDGLAAAPSIAKVAAIDALLQINDASAADELVNCLADPSPDVRAASAAAAQHFGNVNALDALLTDLDEEPPQVLKAKLDAVSSFGRQAVLPVLNTLAACGWASHALGEALRGLGAAASGTAADLLKAEDPGMRALGASAIGYMQEVRYAARLANAVIDESPQVRDAAIASLSSFGAEGIEALVGRLSGPDPAERELRAHALVSLGGPAIDAAAAVSGDLDHNVRLGVLAVLALAKRECDLPIMIRGLQDAVPVVRAQACVTLSQIHTREAANALADAIYQDDDHVVQAAIAGLSKLDEFAHQVLIPRLITGEGRLDPRIARAMDAIGEDGLASVAAYLDSKEPTLRAAAAGALGYIGNADDIPALSELLADQETEVRSAASDALVRQGVAAVPSLLSVLWEGKHPSCSAAGDALREIGQPALEPLASGLRPDIPARARGVAIMVLTEMGASGAAPAIASFVNDPEEDVRVAASLAMQHFEYTDALQDLFAQLENETQAAMKTKMSAIASMGDPAVPIILEALEIMDRPKETRLAQTLRSMGEVASYASVRMLADAKPHRRALGAQGLGILEAGQYLDELTAAVTDPDEGVGQAAIDAVAGFGNLALQALLEHLSEPDPARRERYARALAALGDEAVDTVRGRLSDADINVKLMVLCVLGIRALPADVEVVGRLLGDNVPEVRAAVCHALGSFSGTAPAEMVVRAVHDNDESVVAAAIEGLRALGEAGTDALVGRLTAASGDVDEKTAQALASLGSEGLSVLHGYLEHGAADMRAVAAQTLAWAHDDSAIMGITGLLGDPDPGVQDAAVAALAQFGGAAVAPTYEVLNRGQRDTTGSAADALVAIGPPAVPVLLGGLDEGPTLARSTALRCLVLIGDETAAEKTASYLADPEPQMRAASALAVQRFKYAPALGRLLDGIDSEPKEVREAKLAAIGSFRETAVPVLVERLEDPEYAESRAVFDALNTLKDIAAKPVTEMLEHASPVRRFVATRALRAMRAPEARDALLKTVLDTDPNVRSGAADALAALGPDAGEALLQGLGNSDAAVREMYAAAIARQPNEVLERVAVSLIDGDVPTRLVALDTLGRAARPAFFGEILTCLEDVEPAVRSAACSALTGYESREAVEAIARALYDDDPSVYDTALKCLASLQDIAYEVLLPKMVDEKGEVDQRILRAMSAAGAAAGPVLRECLQRESTGVRAAAAVALGSVAGQEAVPDLIPLLDDREEAVRAAVVKSLLHIGEAAVSPALAVLLAGKLPGCLAAAEIVGEHGEQYVDDLIPTLRSDKAGGRAAAARALGRLGDRRSAAHLIGRLRDQEAVVRAEAAAALGLMAWANATPHLLGAIDDEDLQVSKAAINALIKIGPPAIEVLLQRLIDETGEIRDDVVYALAGIGDASVGPIVRMAEGADVVVRVAGARVLAIIGGEAAVGPLVNGLFDAESAVRTECLRGIQSVGREAVPELISRLSAETRPHIAERLSRALASLREAALPEVISLLEGRDERLRQFAADILGEMGMVAAAALRRAMAHQNASVRTLALRGISGIGDVSVVPDIVELLQDEDTGVVGEAIRTLATLQDPRGVRPVVSCIGSPSPAIKDALAFAIPRFGPSVAAPLADMLVSSDTMVVDQATSALKSLGKGSVSALERKLHSDLPEMRAAAARVMGILDTHAVIAPLVARLGDHEEGVRMAAAEALGRIGGPAVAPVLERLVENDQRVNDGILKALHAMTVDPVFTLMEYARNSEEDVRLAAVKMAGLYGRNESVKTLQQRLHDTSLEINVASAEALGRIGTDDAINVLAQASTTDRDDLAKALEAVLLDHAPTSIPALVRLASRPKGDPDPAYVAVATEIARQAPGIVDELLGDDEEPIRRAAAVVLGDVGSSQSLRSLVRKARDPDVPVRRAAAVALGRMGKGALGPLSSLLEDEDAEVQKSAADVLAGMGQTAAGTLVRKLRAAREDALRITICKAIGAAQTIEASDALRHIVKHETDSPVGVCAAAALAQLGDPVGKEALQKALSSSDDDVRGEAAEATAGFGGEAALSLLTLVDDPSPRVRTAATSAFEHVTRDDLPLLVQYAQHRDATVRAAVGRALRDAPQDPTALRTLVGLLQDDDDRVCTAAVESLAVFGEAALHVLGDDATSDDSDRRYAACWALSQLGTQAVGTLMGAVQAGDPEARADILRALGRIGDPSARQAVLPGLDDPNPRVRVAAVGAMRRLASEEDGQRLAGMLTDDDANVRMVATSVVAAVMSDSLREQIIDLLKSPVAETRAAAAQVLRQDAHHSSAGPLRKAISREMEPWVVELMEGALEILQDV